jgi:lipopolysaccharide transport system ATP-binding protein
MEHLAVRVEHLSKKYRLGTRDRRPRTLTEAILGFLRYPIANLSTLRRLSSFSTDTDEADVLWALKDVSFQVGEGEILGIIGSNGAGKSTLLRILSRITLPSEGSAHFRGRVASLLEVGTGFHPELTGRENVYLNGSILGMTKTEIDRKFDAIIEFSEIERFIDTPVKRYSSGMRVRLAFAVAAHLEPEILLVDEVLAVGDAAFQRKCLGKMNEVSQLGRTVLFVSHNLPAMMRLCPRALVLERGKLVMDAPSEEAVSHYLRSVTSGGRRREWSGDSAPGGGSAVRLRAVGVVTDGGSPEAVLKVNQQITIEIEYEARESTSFRCAVVLWFQGACAFAGVEPSEAARPAPGLYRTQVTIPPNLLVEGQYAVSVSMFSSRGAKSHLVQEDDTVLFDVADPMDGSSNRGDYTGRMAGVVMPRLDWRTHTV